MFDTQLTAQIRLNHRSAAYWGFTFDRPPLNIFGPQHMPALNAAIAAIGLHRDVKAMVFNRAACMSGRYQDTPALSRWAARMLTPRRSGGGLDACITAE